MVLFVELGKERPLLARRLIKLPKLRQADLFFHPRFNIYSQIGLITLTPGEAVNFQEEPALEAAIRSALGK